MFEFTTSSEFFDVALAQARNIANLDVEDLTERLGLLVLEQTQERFNTKRDPEDEKWQAWSPSHARFRRRNRGGAGLMILSGDLFDSLHLQQTATTAVIGSSSPYAGYHQEPSAASQRRGAVKRSFLGISDEDEADLDQETAMFLGEALLV